MGERWPNRGLIPGPLTGSAFFQNEERLTKLKPITPTLTAKTGLRSRDKANKASICQIVSKPWWIGKQVLGGSGHSFFPDYVKQLSV